MSERDEAVEAVVNDIAGWVGGGSLREKVRRAVESGIKLGEARAEKRLSTRGHGWWAQYWADRAGEATDEIAKARAEGAREAVQGAFDAVLELVSIPYPDYIRIDTYHDELVKGIEKLKEIHKLKQEYKP